MGDHFVLLVDRLLTESTLGAAIESQNRYLEAMEPASDLKLPENTSHKVDVGNVSSTGKLVECRICQDEDDDRNMETPCSCCGSLKYAHRRCVQRWCNEKGNTLCEICHQQFKPGYTAPPPLFQFGRVPMNFRGNWEVYRGDLNGPRFIAMVSPDRSFSDPAYNENSHSVSRSLTCCRSVACLFMVLLILRHALPVLLSDAREYSLPLLMLLSLRTVGIVLPIYIIIRVLTAVQRHRRQQVSPSSSFDSSDEETESSTQQPPPQATRAN
ncbi:RING-CH-type domain-containing protein [Psidium guajava]|nr:RING-CH-type domain-containing protein [Psidium guajava]